MILQSQIMTDLKINRLEDLNKLKIFMEASNLKINKSQIARKLGVDRRTVDKYVNGFQNRNIVVQKIVCRPTFQSSKNYSLMKMSSCSIIGVFFGNTSAIITGIPADILTSVII